MNELDAIKERTTRIADFETMQAERDRARLLAAIDDIESRARIAEGLCEMNGTDMRLASVPVVQIRAAITAALTPAPDVTGGAGAANGAGVAPVDTETKLGLQNGQETP